MTHSDAYKPTISLCCSALAHTFSQQGLSPFSSAYNTNTSKIQGAQWSSTAKPAGSDSRAETVKGVCLHTEELPFLNTFFVQQELPFSKQGLSSRYCPSQNGTALLRTHFVQEELPFSKHVLSSRNCPSQNMFCPAGTTFLKACFVQQIEAIETELWIKDFVL